MAKEEQTAIIDDFNDEDKVENNLNLWDYNESNEIVGIIERKEQGMYGDQIILKDNTNEEVVIPSLTALNTQLFKANVGDKVKIVYKGEEKSKKTGRMYKNFEVFIKKA